MKKSLSVKQFGPRLRSGYKLFANVISRGQNRVHTDLEKSLNLTLVLENSWNLKKVPFVLEFCKNILENKN